MNKVLEEGNFLFDFSAFTYVERFDKEFGNPAGLRPVDFVLENSNTMYFFEVKDFVNPKTPSDQVISDYDMLREAVKKGVKSVFNLEMGEKIKDSLLRKYALGHEFLKNVCYLLFINVDNFAPEELGRLKEKISGYIPTGLNNKKYNSFTKITFELVNREQLKNHNISCTVKS
jgi:hypothetical protein